MNASTEIRTKYNFSQVELANCLGISPSMLAMIETGKRRLPLAALKKLNILASSYEKTSNNRTAAVAPTPTAKELAAMRRTIKKRLALTNGMVSRLQSKIEKISREYNVGLLQSAGLEKIILTIGKKENCAGAALHLHETNYSLGKANPLELALMRIKLASLELEAGMLRELLGRAPSRMLDTGR